MAQKKTVKKSLRQSIKKRDANRRMKRRVREAMKEFLNKPNQDKLKALFSLLDKAVKKGIFHKNKGNRLKSQYHKKVRAETKKTTKAKTRRM